MPVTNNKNRIFFIVLSFALSLAIISGCGSFTQLRQPGGAVSAPNTLYTLPPGEFSKLWLQRTVKLSLNASNGASPLGGGQGGPRGRSVPMDVSVTLMDPALISAGLKEFENLSQMTENERSEYETKYNQQYKTQDSHLFWMEITSTYSDEAFDIDKWTFYIQDDKGNSVEPDKIIEDTLPQPVNTYAEQQPGRSNGMPERQRSNFLRMNSKRYLISFAKKNNTTDIMSNAKMLKVIFFEWSTREMQREGIIDLTKIGFTKSETGK